MLLLPLLFRHAEVAAATALCYGWLPLPAADISLLPLMLSILMPIADAIRQAITIIFLRLLLLSCLSSLLSLR